MRFDEREGCLFTFSPPIQEVREEESNAVCANLLLFPAMADSQNRMLKDTFLKNRTPEGPIFVGLREKEGE